MESIENKPTSQYKPQLGKQNEPHRTFPIVTRNVPLKKSSFVLHGRLRFMHEQTTPDLATRIWPLFRFLIHWKVSFNPSDLVNSD